MTQIITSSNGGGKSQSGNVVGPASSTDGDIAVFDGTTGKLIKDSGTKVSDLQENSNTKTFYLSSTSDLTNAQAAYDWYVAGKNPIIVINNVAYTVSGSISGFLFFISDMGRSDGNSNSTVQKKGVTFILSGGSVTNVNNSGDTSCYYLDTNVDYSTPYTPLYNGSPATKKYVDDKQKTITVTLTSAGWSSSTQTVSATGVTASNTVIVSPAPASISTYADNGVYCYSQASGTLTFKCSSTPSSDITVNVVIMS